MIRATLPSRKACDSSSSLQVSSLLARLKECCSARNLKQGKQYHEAAIQAGQDSNLYVASALVSMYANCGSMEDARTVFDTLRHPSVVSWTALILGYADNGEGSVALDLFSRMRYQGCAPDARAFVAALKACIDVEHVGACGERGDAMYLLALRNGCCSDIYVRNVLVDMYAKRGCMDDARSMFEAIEHPNVVSWNSLIFGYVENGEDKSALDLFSSMRFGDCEPDVRTLVAALKAWTNLISVNRGIGRELHLLASRSGLDSDFYVECSLIGMYAKGRCMDSARAVFESMHYHGTVPWNALICGYEENGDGPIALELFARMRHEAFAPDSITIVAALKACIDERPEESRDRVRVLHLLASKGGFDMELAVGNTLVDVHAKCGSLGDASAAFEVMEVHDAVSWNALILGHADNGKAGVALDLFLRMRDEGCAPDARTFLGVIKACSTMGALELGKAAHAEICKRGFDRDVIFGTCLIDFYSKCGSLEESKHVFDSLASGRLEAWNALLAGYSRHGDTKAVFGLFESVRCRDLEPDAVTFSILLASCSHAGLVEQANYYFNLMTTEYGVRPDLEHYHCMVDVLGRANKLDQSMQVLRSMPYSPNALSWMTIMASCRKWRNAALGRIVFESLVSIDDRNAGAYVSLASA